MTDDPVQDRANLTTGLERSRALHLHNQAVNYLTKLAELDATSDQDIASAVAIAAQPVEDEIDYRLYAELDCDD